MSARVTWVREAALRLLTGNPTRGVEWAVSAANSLWTETARTAEEADEAARARAPAYTASGQEERKGEKESAS